MTLNRFAARTDKNEREIIKALEKVGAHVYRIKKPLDLLVCYQKTNILLEVKTKKGKVTEAQYKFLSSWPGPVFIVHSIEDAIKAVTEWS